MLQNVSEMLWAKLHSASACHLLLQYNQSRWSLIRGIVGVRGIFRGLRHATASVNVRVNLVAPFWIDTPLVHSKLVEMAYLGITPGSGFSFASVNDCVNVATTFATDATVSGRAYAVIPEGFVDMDDEESSGWAGEILKEEWEMRTSLSDMVH